MNQAQRDRVMDIYAKTDPTPEDVGFLVDIILDFDAPSLRDNPNCPACPHTAHPKPPEGENCGCYDPEGVCAFSRENPL